MMKGILQLKHRMRDVEFVVFATYLGPADSTEVTAATQLNSQHNKVVNEEGRGHGRGPPYVYTYGGAQRALTKKEEATMGAPLLAALKEIYEKHDSMSWKGQVDQV